MLRPGGMQDAGKWISTEFCVCNALFNVFLVCVLIEFQMISMVFWWMLRDLDGL